MRYTFVALFLFVTSQALANCVKDGDPVNVVGSTLAQKRTNCLRMGGKWTGKMPETTETTSENSNQGSNEGSNETSGHSSGGGGGW